MHLSSLRTPESIAQLERRFHAPHEIPYAGAPDHSTLRRQSSFASASSWAIFVGSLS